MNAENGSEPKMYLQDKKKTCKMKTLSSSSRFTHSEYACKYDYFN